jgi:hypothetical protein
MHWGFLFPEIPSQRLKGLEETKNLNTLIGVLGLYLEQRFFSGSTQLICKTHIKHNPKSKTFGFGGNKKPKYADRRIEIVFGTEVLFWINAVNLYDPHQTQSPYTCFRIFQ